MGKPFKPLLGYTGLWLQYVQSLTTTCFSTPLTNSPYTQLIHRVIPSLPAHPVSLNFLLQQQPDPFLFSRPGKASIPHLPAEEGLPPTSAALHRKSCFSCTFPEMRHSTVISAVPVPPPGGGFPSPDAVLQAGLCWALGVLHWPVLPACSDPSKRLGPCFPQALEWDWHPSNSLSPPCCIF